MRRVPALLLVLLSVALVGAGRPPAPTPAPKPSVTATPAALVPSAALPSTAPHNSMPMVVVFPFETSTDLKAGSGQNAAQVFVDQMNADGGLDTIQAPATVKRADYLSYAKNLNADYYVTGYLTPLGNGVSLVEQVVSTRSGTIVYGKTAQIDSFLDATAQATSVHDGIVALEQQMSAAYSQAQAQATSTPMPNNQANISRGIAGLAGLFKHKAKETPAPSAAKPSKGVLVAHVAGALPAADLNRATTDLFNALDAHYNARLTNASGENLAKSADGICGKERNNTIATGTASATSSRHGLLGSRVEYKFVLSVYTCFGAKLAESAATGGSMSSAVRGAVDNYAKSHPDNG